MLHIAGLWVSYPDKADVLRDIHLDIQEGAKVGLVGANGSGKTTLFLTICGILSATRGTIVLNGTPVVPGAFRPEIGLVFQNPDDQLFCPTVGDDVAFGPINIGLTPAEIEARVHEALAATGIAHLRHRAPHHLSGGEKRMVAIAGILAMRPRLIIYDEPDAYLDIRARRRIVDFLREAEQTLLIASHNLELIDEVCQRVVVMEQGAVVSDGAGSAVG